MYKVVKSFNGGYCTLIEKDGEFFAYDNINWNGESYTHCWHCDSNGIQLDDDKAKYRITPILEGRGEQYEDGSYESFEEVDAVIEKM